MLTFPPQKTSPMRLTLPFITLVTVLLLWGCKPEPAAPFDVVALVGADPQDLHPTNARTAVAFQVLDFMHERLIELNKFDNTPAPNLASEISKSADGLTYTYTLHPAAKWPDGKPMTPEDVIFSYKVMACPLVNNLNQKGYLESLATIDTDPADSRKVIFRMKTPYQLNDYIANLGYIIDERVYDSAQVLRAYPISDFLSKPDSFQADSVLATWAAAFNDPANGTELSRLSRTCGPYRLAAWTAGEEVVLEKQPGYWGNDLPDAPGLKGPAQIRFKVLKDDKAVELALVNGEIDVATSLTTEAYRGLEANDSAKSRLNLVIQARSTVAYMALNNNPVSLKAKPVFTDARVRKAIALAMPMDSIISQFLYGMAVRANSPIPPHHPDYHSGLKPVPYQPEQARTLLEEAGWQDSDRDGVFDKVINGKKEPLRFTLLYPAGQQSIANLAERVKESLAAIGVECNPEPAQNIAQRLRAHDFDAAFTAFGSPNLPFEFKQNWHSSNWPNGDNFIGYRNPVVDSLIDISRVEMDLTRRKQLTDQIQQLIADDQPVVFFYTPFEKIAYSRRFGTAKLYQFRPYIYLNELELSPAK